MSYMVTFILSKTFINYNHNMVVMVMGEVRRRSCLFCGESFILTVHNKKYCSNSCWNKMNYKKKGRVKRNLWEKERYWTDDNFRQKLLKKNIVNSKKWRERNKKLGNCSRCGRYNPNPPNTVCPSCIDIKNWRR